ncbi:MAG: PspC domain-containing protein [Rubrobacteraceae bacterium]
MNLKRATRDRWIFGVCGGIAQTYGWSSNMVRLALAIVAVVIPGISVVPALIIYVLLGIFLPETDEF